MNRADTTTTVGESPAAISTVAAGLAAATTLHAFGALIQVVAGGPIRWYADGRTPTASTGFICVEFGVIELFSHWEVIRFLAIKDTTGNDATLEVMARK